MFFALLHNLQKMGLLLVIFSYKQKSQNYDMKHTVLAALNRQQQPNHYQNFLTVAGKTINSFLCSSIKVIIYKSHGEVSLLETSTIEGVFLGYLTLSGPGPHCDNRLLYSEECRYELQTS